MYNIEFSFEELILLETILKKTLKADITTNHFTVTFTQEEMESIEEILLNEMHKNLDCWYDLFEKNKSDRPTKEMSIQWKYTGRIEEIYDRIAAPIGRSKRADPKELEEYL